MKPFPVLIALLVLGGGEPAQEEVLENDYVKVTIDPEKGGAVTSMISKKATTFPFIAEKGAQRAGSGSLFVPSLDGVDLASAALKPERGREGEDSIVRLSGRARPGLELERTFRMSKEESGFRLRDAWRMEKSGGEFKPGQSSLLAAEAWRETLRSSYGDEERTQTSLLPGARARKASYNSSSARAFWRVAGPYGVGFLAQTTAGVAPFELGHEPLEGRGCGVAFRLETPRASADKGKLVEIETAVLIDDSGREATPVPGVTRFNRTVLTLDVRAAGRVGDTLPGTVTLVSAAPHRGSLVVSQGSKELLRLREVALEPGKRRIFLFDVAPEGKGTLELRAAWGGEAWAKGEAVIEVEDSPVWKAHLKRIPSATYKGTWAQIGAQLARAGRLKPRPADARAAERRGFCERQFPYYAELIRGAAEALGVKPEELVRSEPAGFPAGEACMDVFFNGPDGPINAFSKERSNAGLGGLAYMKVLPDKGYAYHVYECGSWQNGYGVNSEGLSTSGASINCDGGTTSVGRKATQDWKASGKQVAPLGSHMMLATCGNVEEAIAFIESPAAPFEFEGNMLLVDRAGNAARLESVGIRHQIHRYDPKRDRFFVAGNYPHEGKDGLFKIGPDGGWAANTMMRERLLEELAGDRQGKLSLKNAFALMETHAAGGMCQHVHDNVGRLMTSNSFIAVCRTGDLWLSHGPPCKYRYYRFNLKDGE